MGQKIELKTTTLVDIGTNKVYACKTIWKTDQEITYISLKLPIKQWELNSYAFENKFTVNKTK